MTGVPTAFGLVGGRSSRGGQGGASGQRFARTVDLKHEGKPVGDTSAVETYKVGWTDAKPAIRNAH